MAYTKHTWVAPEGDNLNRFSKANETEQSVDLIQNPNLTNTPTPFSVEWLNEMEAGIAEAHERTEIGDNDENAGVVSGGHDFNSVYIDPQGKMRVPGLHTFPAQQVEGMGRDLMKVVLGHGIEEMTTQSLRNEAIAEVTANIRMRHNNNGEIDGSGMAKMNGLAPSDFLDGLDLSGIAAPTSGNAPQAWNNTYKNNRLLIGGFNSYKHSGDTEITKNHTVMVFRHIVAKGRINSTSTNTGGYPASELRGWLDGASGDGSGTFAAGLKAALGGNNPLLTIRKLISTKGSWSWNNFTVFPLSTLEVFGSPGFAETDYGDGVGIHLPIYQDGSVFRVKRWNGSRDWWWLIVPSASSSSSFCYCSSRGNGTHASTASSVGGVAPAFCVA